MPQRKCKWLSFVGLGFVGLGFVGLGFVGLGLLGAGTYADDWRQFRGPSANGVISDNNVPDSWSSESNIKWKASVPGEGWSAPIVVGQKVILTTAVSEGQKNKSSAHDWKVICLDANTGKQLWTKLALHSKPRLGTHRDNTYATETPVTDGKFVVAYFGMMGVFCYDLDGNEVWKKDLGNFTMNGEPRVRRSFLTALSSFKSTTNKSRF
jgi:outer membrane protein assembly factor BamB